MISLLITFGRLVITMDNPTRLERELLWLRESNRFNEFLLCSNDLEPDQWYKAKASRKV